MENIKASIEVIKKEFTKIEEELAIQDMPDFSKFISRYENHLFIKGKEKILISNENGDIKFGKFTIKADDKVTSTLTTLSELKEGDVFILKSSIALMSEIDFNVMLGLDINGDIRLTYIENKGCDYLDYMSWHKDNTEVYKINRY